MSWWNAAWEWINCAFKILQNSRRVNEEPLFRQIAGLSDEFRTSLPPLLSFPAFICVGLQFHQLTSRWRPSLTKPQDWASLKQKHQKINQTRSSLQSDSALKLLVVLPWRDFFFSTNTHLLCPLFHLTTSPISHLGSNLRRRRLNCYLHANVFFHVISRICECDDTRTHVSVTCVCVCIRVVLVFTIEWFVHINIFYVMLNVLPWWLFLGLFWLVDTLHERQQGLNWTDALCPEVQHLILNEWMSK